MNAGLMGDFTPPPEFCQAQGRFGFYAKSVINDKRIHVTDMRSPSVFRGMIDENSRVRAKWPE